MDVGSAGFVEKPGDETFVVIETAPTNRADPGTIPAQAMGAAVDVHEPVGLAHGGKGGGFYPLAVEQLDGADRTGPGHSGFALQIVVFAPFPSACGTAPGAGTEKETIAKVEKAYADNDKPQHLKIGTHSIVSIATDC
jgi:hypothetical protein